MTEFDLPLHGLVFAWALAAVAVFVALRLFLGCVRVVVQIWQDVKKPNRP